MEEIYKKAFKEVYEILKYVPDEDKKKIPEDFIKIIEDNMNKEYEFKIDKSTDFENQKLLEETKAILAIIYRDYWATREEKEAINMKFKNDIEKAEEAKKNKYNIDNLFKKLK